MLAGVCGDTGKLALYAVFAVVVALPKMGLFPFGDFAEKGADANASLP